MQVLADLIVGIKLVENGVRPEGPGGDSFDEEPRKGAAGERRRRQLP